MAFEKIVLVKRPRRVHPLPAPAPVKRKKMVKKGGGATIGIHVSL